jgi:hypothetical protein
MLEEDVLEGAVSREELDRFKKRHPEFAGAATRLQTVLDRALNRRLHLMPNKPDSVQSTVFAIGHQAADDFFDILFLAVHGYGMGAVKLLRPLYERVVTALYLMKHPSEVSDFNDYADVQAHQIVSRAKQDGVDLSPVATDEQLAQIEDAYKHSRSRFVSRKGRPRGSWTSLRLDVLARDVGLEQLYGACALWPTMLIHSTRLGVETRMAVAEQDIQISHGPQPQHADYALKHAHRLIMLLLWRLNEFLALGLDLTTEAREADDCWRDP